MCWWEAWRCWAAIRSWPYSMYPRLVIANAHRLLIIFGLILWVRAMNATIVLGVLRAGGDTRFSLFLDGFIIWIVGVPLAALGVFVFHLPVHWVYLLAMSEEVTKCCLGLIRFFSRKWIHNLTHTLHDRSPST